MSNPTGRRWLQNLGRMRGVQEVGKPWDVRRGLIGGTNDEAGTWSGGPGVKED